MKRRDQVILLLICLNFIWFGWRVYAAHHVPVKSITTISAKEIIGKEAQLSGDSGAKYVVVEFGDYQCPPCARMYTQLEEFTQKNRSKVRFQFRQYPLPSHALAFPAALIAEKARKSGKFATLHHTLFALNAKLDEETLRSIAKKHGISYVSTSGDDVKPQDREYEAIINDDKRVANKVPIAGTPSLFLCTPDQQVYQIYSVQQAKDLIH
jgi:protein-disulfide isomerase